MGIDFVDVSLKQPKEVIADQLFGSAAAAERAQESGVPPGILGQSSPVVVYLSDFQNVDLSLVDSLYRTIKSRAYLDRLGTQWKLNEDLWLIGALTIPSPNSTIAYEHKICGAFQQTVLLAPPSSSADLLSICRSLSADHPSPREVATDVGEFLANYSGTPENLHAVRRWLSLALDLADVRAPITTEIVRRAIESDLQWVFSRLVYRGRALTLDRFQRWISQFPTPHSPLAMHLVRQIADAYYVSNEAYFDALNDLIQGSGVPPNSRVVFCKWQHTGASAPAVAHDLKNQANWKVLGEIDLDQPSSSWPTFAGPEPAWFVLADDFVGSGGTLATFFANKSDGLSALLEKYRLAKVRILTVVGFESGLRLAQRAIPASHRSRVQILAARLFQNEDTCFHPTSKILVHKEQREQFKNCCLELAKVHFETMKPEMRLGYDNLGAIIVFFNTVPNNSLPILWYTTGHWFPLFPASGLLAE